MTKTKRWTRQSSAALALLGGSGLIGCNEIMARQPLPAGTESPSFYNTPAGALGMRNAAIYAVEQEIPSFLIDAGLLTDELESNQTGASVGEILNNPAAPTGGLLDARILPELINEAATSTHADDDYSQLQGIRGSVNQALGALAAYDSAAPPALRGELYALKGYAEILLADLFCSGVPLSTLNFQGDFTYHAGSTTQQVYQDAVSQEDSALALTSANDTLQNLARVLKGRALLDLGGQSVAQAAQVVAAVPDGFQYQLAIQWNPHGNAVNLLNQSATISDYEGGTGLPFVSGGDPRVANSAIECPGDATSCPVPLVFPARYNTDGYSQFTVADWIEARLIQAEAALQANPHDPTWLTPLNHLRQTATVPGQTGTLTTLTDPGDSPGDTARVNVLFRERAFWLFLTGHRQGDLRRLIRQDGRRQDQVYPTGPYLAPGAQLYGNDVTAPVPAREYTNPLFHGCIDRGA